MQNHIMNNSIHITYNYEIDRYIFNIYVTIIIQIFQIKIIFKKNKILIHCRFINIIRNYNVNLFKGKFPL